MKKIIFLLLLLDVFSINTVFSQSQSEIANGLKEALRVGAENSVLKANKKDGYFKDNRIRIPFPEEVIFVKKSLEKGPSIGRKIVSDFEMKLNRAAEKAAIKAKPILINAITGINIGEATQILTGTDDAATKYLKTATYNNLVLAFKPDIKKSLEQAGAQKAWKDVVSKYNIIPFHKKVNTDLAQYTTEKALDGLFILIADEEAKIRKDPAARVSDVLKKVFGNIFK